MAIKFIDVVQKVHHFYVFCELFTSAKMLCFLCICLFLHLFGVGLVFAITPKVMNESF